MKRLRWWNAELDELKADTIRIRRKIKKANPRRKLYVIGEYKTSLELYKAAIVNARTTSWKEFCTSQERESVWDRIYRLMRCSGRTSEEILLRSGGRSLDARESADLLASTFYPKDNLDEDEPYHKEVRNIVRDFTLRRDPEEVFTPVELHEINHVLVAVSPKKAPGEDGLTADICLRAFQMEPIVLQTLFNGCLSTGHFPRSWKRAVIKVIKKPAKDDYSEPKAYRPIGLLPIYGKVLEKIVCSRLLWSLGRAKDLSEKQYGFVPQKSTEDALYDATTIIRAGLDQKELVAVVSLDIEGAFDNAWWPETTNRQKLRAIHNQTP